MIKSPRDLSVVDLEKLLHGKKSELEQLLKKREQLEKQLSDVVEKIRSVEGRKNGGEPGALGRRLPYRLQNEKTLKQVVTELLTENPKGLGLDDLSKKVLATGYRTTSTNFKNTLYQCLYNHERINLDKKNGLYLLK
jgi:hypothetical protein